MADPDRAKSTIVTISHTLTHAMCHYPASTYHLCTEKCIVLYALIRPNSQNKLGFHNRFVVQQIRFQKHFLMSSNCKLYSILSLSFSLSHTLFFFKVSLESVLDHSAVGIWRGRGTITSLSRGPISLKGSQTQFWDQDTEQISF